MNLTFLGWDKPILHTAVEHLLRQERYFQTGRLDMGNVLCALPGGRAGRRLEELLLEEVERRIAAGALDPDWIPPRVLTLGQLPEELYPLKRPRADDLTQLFTWIAAMRDYRDEAPDLFARLIPDLPDDADLGAWWELARLFSRMHRELAAETLDCEHVARLCRELGIVGEGDRWDVLAALEQKYLDRLDQLQLWDIQTARLFALKKEEPIKEPPHQKEIVLIGTVDLNRTQKKLLEMVSPRVSVLVFAPESTRELFDEFGCAAPEKWDRFLWGAFASDDHAAAGKTVSPACARHRLSIPESMIQSVTTPAEQATAVLKWLAGLEKREPGNRGAEVGATPGLFALQKYAPDEITLGVADESIVPFLQEQLAQCGLQARYGAGMKMETNTVYRLLVSLSRYLDERRFPDFADLLRHPALGTMKIGSHIQTSDEDHADEDRIEPEIRDENEEESPEEDTDSQGESTAFSSVPVQDAITQLDRYMATFLPVRVPFGADSPDWRAVVVENAPRHNCDFALLRNVVATFDAHCGILSDKRDSRNTPPVRRLPEKWCPAIRAFLDALFPPALRKEDRLARAGLATAEQMLDRLAAIPTAVAVPISAPQMIDLLLRLMKPQRIAPEFERESIEMLGWLELAMDDAPVMGITGMNEGVISPAHSSDMFLPNRIRGRLHLEDNDRRFARDAYGLTVILNSRGIGSKADAAPSSEPVRSGKVLLVAGRRGADGEALLPSRLFFAADPETLVHRAAHLFKEREESAPVVFPGSVRPGHAGEAQSAFAPPTLPPLAEPPKTMHPTEFRDYLACPYRYFLKHRLRLKSVDDHVEELDGGAFGSLAHDLFEAFGRDKDLSAATVPDVIADWLGRRLDQLVLERYGASPRPVVAIQIEQLRTRLKAFAPVQAAWVEKGYRIVETELPFEVPFAVDGEELTLVGRIDRIDYNPRTDEYVLLDYKTSDKGDSPDEVHRPGKREPRKWVDLQLPLYRYAFQKLRDRERPGEPGKSIRVGYMVLPKDVSKTKAAIADDWEAFEFNEAIDLARRVVRDIRENIRDGRFEMNPKPPAFSEAFAAICLDRQVKM